MGKTMCFIISNGFEKAGRATRAFQFAKLAKEQGHDVSVVLIDEAVIWAQLGMSEGVKAITGEEMKPFIDYLVEKGAPIYACKACVDRRYMSPDEMLTGVEIEPGPFVVNLAATSDTTISF